MICSSSKRESASGTDFPRRQSAPLVTLREKACIGRKHALGAMLLGEFLCFLLQLSFQSPRLLTLQKEDAFEMITARTKSLYRLVCLDVNPPAFCMAGSHRPQMQMRTLVRENLLCYFCFFVSLSHPTRNHLLPAVVLL